MNLDEKKALLASMNKAIEGGDTEEFVNLVDEKVSAAVAKEVEEKVLAKYRELEGINDENVLAQRGILPLTSDEKKFYNAWEDAIRNELTNPELLMPKTTENKIYEYIKRDHELLNAIDFVNNGGITEWVISKDLDYAYAWGDLNSAITQKASAAFAKFEFSNYKLHTWIPIPITLVELGMTWMDQFVVTYLSEIIARALEKAIITGDGQKKPVGMMKTIDIESQTLPAVDKTALEITDLTPWTIGEIASKLTNEGKRKVGIIDMIVNPSDYWEYVYPSIFYVNQNGQIVMSNVPLRIIQSSEVPAGKAVFGICSEYFATFGFGVKNGKIQYSDEVKFLEDTRCYKARAVAWGTPKDNTCFEVADITKLAEAAMPTRAQKTRS